jgi:hypothetical protein
MAESDAGIPRAWRLSVRAAPPADQAGVLMSCAVTARPLYVGRAPTNDVVLDDDRISGRHCAISSNAGRVFVEDLSSRNGSWIGERRVRKVEPWAPGERLRLGNAFELALEPVKENKSLPPLNLLALRDERSGLTLPLRNGRLRIGGPDADVEVDRAVERMVMVDPDGQAWVGTEEGALEPLAMGESIAVGDHRYTLIHAIEGIGATRDAAFTPWPYRLKVGMNGPLGPTAEVLHEDRVAGTQRVTWTAENRVVVWWLLGKKLEEDRQAGLDTESAGWIAEQEVATGVWGRDAALTNLGVLLTRIRHDLRRAELDPWFLERRRGHLRARVAHVEVSA